MAVLGKRGRECAISGTRGKRGRMWEDLLLWYANVGPLPTAVMRASVDVFCEGEMETSHDVTAHHTALHCTTPHCMYQHGFEDDVVLCQCNQGQAE